MIPELRFRDIINTLINIQLSKKIISENWFFHLFKKINYLMVAYKRRIQITISLFVKDMGGDKFTTRMRFIEFRIYYIRKNPGLSTTAAVLKVLKCTERTTSLGFE